MPLIIGVGALILLVIIISWVQNQVERGRGDRLKAQAEVMGFRYSEEGDPRLLHRTASLLLFNQGVSGRIRNAMSREPAASAGTGAAGTAEQLPAEPEVAVFEYAFDVPTGRFVRSWPQTIVRLSSASLSWPYFSVMPTALFDIMAARAGNKEMRELLTGSAGLVLHEHPTFTSQSHVVAFEREKVRALLSDDLIAFYEAHPHLCTEASDTTLIFYVFDRVVKAKDIPTFLSEALEAYGMLRTAVGHDA
jgi:hypothetical protein